MAEKESFGGSNRSYGATDDAPSVGFSETGISDLFKLCQDVGHNINHINSGLRTLEKYMKQIGGKNDNMQLREKIHETRQKVNGHVSGTTRDIQRAGQMVQRGNKPQELLVAKLKQSFKDSLDKYASVQKDVSEKMMAHMPKQTLPKNDPEALERQAIADDEESQLLANQQAQARQVEFETNAMLDKQAYINQIETDVLDVNQIMQELATTVIQQGQTVDSLEAHIEATASQVEAGQEELAKAAEYRRRYRRRMFILMVIGIFFAMLFLIWLIR